MVLALCSASVGLSCFVAGLCCTACATCRVYVPCMPRVMSCQRGMVAVVSGSHMSDIVVREGFCPTCKYL